MTINLIINMILLVASAAAFIRGALKNFRSKKALYIWLVTCAVGCAFVAALFETIQIWVRPDLIGGYQLGLLGLVGEYLFFFTANHGEIDSLGDDGSKTFFKYRMISLVISVILLAAFVPLAWMRGMRGFTLIVVLIVALVITAALYYHIKHLIIPDVEDGILKSMRYYNLIGIINCLAGLLSLLTIQGTVVWAITVVIRMIVVITVLPVMERGVKRWTA